MNVSHEVPLMAAINKGNCASLEKTTNNCICDAKEDECILIRGRRGGIDPKFTQYA